MPAGHTDRETINRRRPMTDATRNLLRRMVEEGGVHIGCDQGNASRSRALKDRGYAIPPATPGGRWSATDAGRAALAAQDAFEEPGTSWSERRSGREGRSIPHSYGGEGKNYVD